jgi:hypothetical protein
MDDKTQARKEEKVLLEIFCPNCRETWEQWVNRDVLIALAGIKPSLECPTCHEKI